MSPPRIASLLCLLALAASAAPQPAESFFHVDELTPAVVLDGNAFYIPTYLGPTGMVGWVLGEHLVVREVEPRSPAAGIVLPSDVLASAGGTPLGPEPLKTLGLAVGEAEKTGRLELGLLRAGKKQQVSLKLPVLGAYAKDWPRDCGKSRKALAGACRYLDGIQNANGSFDSLTWVGYALDGLAFLAVEDPRYIENARRIAHYYSRHNNLDATGGTVVWGWGYMGIFLAEYHQLTGDATVLPLMAKVARTLAKWQQPTGTWGHGPNPGLGYVQGGGLNAAGGAAWVALILIQECGVTVDEKALAKAAHFFRRFVDAGTVPYGDHRPEFAITGNSKDALTGIGFALLGDRAAAELQARLVTDGYRERNRGHTGGFLGFTVGNIAGINNPHRPDYRRMLDHWTWLFDVSRSWDGGFLFPHTLIDSIYTYRGPVLGTGAVALVYAIPRKPLRIMGAPKGAAPRLSAAVRKKGVELSLAKARKALDDRDPILAETILTNLSHVATEPRIAPLLAEARAPKFAPVRTAQDIYERYKWLTPVWPEAKAAFEKLAASPDAGVFARLAQKELARPVDSHVWSHYCESLYARVGAWRKDERSKYTLIRTATLKGGNWPRLVAAKELRADGILNNDFVMTWRPLVRISKLDMIEDIPRMPTWRYHARLRDAEPLAPGWAADFDDAAWKQAPGPLSRDAKAPLTVPRGAHWQYVRIAFNLGTTELTTLKLLYTNPRRRANAVAYLNGQPVAFLDEAPAEYRSVDLSPAALKLLRKGRNVLAVRSSGQEFDIGLYAQPKGGRP